MKFSNLKSKRGSVLFIVLLVMSVLIVMAAAVYYTVASQREEVVAEYNGEQAYQTALSVDNIVTSYIVNKKNSNPFKQKMVSLANGASFTTTGGEVDLGSDLGNCKITVTRISNTAYKLVTEVSVNEESARIERILEMTTAVTPSGFDGRFFTSTGLVPNDTYLTGQTITSKTFFDNEFVMFASGSSNTIQADLICAGTLAFENVTFNCTESTDIIVGNNFINSQSQVLDSKGGTYYIGANFKSTSTSGYGTSSNPITMYVLGDMECNGTIYGDVYCFGDFKCGAPIYGNVYVMGSFTTDKTVNGNLYVNKDFTVPTWMSVNGNLSLNGSLLFNGNVGVTINGTQITPSNVASYSPSTWDTAATLPKSVDEIKAYIKSNLGDPQYFAWNLDDKLSDTPISIDFDGRNAFFIYDSGTIVSSINNNNNAPYYKPIIIDTNIYEIDSLTGKRVVSKYQIGDTDPNGNVVDASSRYYNTPKCKDIYLTLQANTVVDGKSAFTWNVGGSGGNPYVLVKGSGNVIFYLPDGVTYKPGMFSYVMHMGWFFELGGTLQYNDDYTDLVSANRASIQNTTAISIAASDIAAYETFDGEQYENLIKQSVRDKYDESAADENKRYVYIHNNIFFVSNDINTSIDLNNQDVGITGFVYAPFMTLELKNNELALTMIGGIIVSDYIMSTTRSFICTIPFDYYHGNKDDLFEDLLNASGDPLGSSVVRDWRAVGYN